MLIRRGAYSVKYGIINYKRTFGVLQIAMKHGGNAIQLCHSPILRGNCYGRYRLLCSQRNCLWKLLHMVLPTDRLLLCHLTASDICPACGMCRDSLQHAFNACQLWHATVNLSTALLAQMSITLPRTTYCPLHLFLLSS